MITSLQMQAILEAFAVGDALGMATEFMTRDEIADSIGCVSGFVDSRLSLHHADLPTGTVTDDTEQTLTLLRKYRDNGVSVASTVEGLLAWIDDSDAVRKKYIGPSSLKALLAIKEGVDPWKAGQGGTTCGGLMRSLAPVLYAVASGSNHEQMLEMVMMCLVPTHNTSQALEAACAYASAIFCALEGGSIADILAAAAYGGEFGMSKAPYLACAASSVARIKCVQEFVETRPSEAELLSFLYSVLGTGLESADVCASVFGLFLYTKGDLFKAICLAASLGGDTDTIAALTGALVKAAYPASMLPASIVGTVEDVNHLGLKEFAEALILRRKL